MNLEQQKPISVITKNEREPLQEAQKAQKEGKVTDPCLFKQEISTRTI